MRLAARPLLTRFAFCLLLLLWIPAPAALAQKRKEPATVAPPPVVPRQVTVSAGESVEVPLGIHGGRGEQLEFLIRARPKNGKLSAVTATGVNSASVTYTAPENAALGEDRFFYAARSNDGVSAPGAVTISIIPKPTLPLRIEVPERIDFPVIVPGDEGSATLEIRNPGSVLVSGVISVSAPWSFEGEAEYQIQPKRRTVFRLLFRPNKPGKFAGEVVLGPNPRKVIALTGEARSAIVAKPERLRIPGAERGQTRMATLELENQSELPQTVTITADPKLMTEKSVALPPKGKVQVPVFAEPGDGGGFQDVLRLASGEWKTEIPVEIEPLRSLIKWAEIPATQLRGVSGRPVEFDGWLENEGGRPIAVSISVNPPFTVSAAKITLGAGEKKAVKVSASELPAGDDAVEVTAESEAAIERLKVKFTADAAAPVAARPSVERVAASVAPPDDGAADAAPEDSPRNFSVGKRRPIMTPVERPNGLGKFYRDIGTDRASLVWPATLGKVDDLHVEERLVTMTPDRELAIHWAKIATAKVETGTDPRRVDFKKLESGKLYTIRVRSGDNVLFTSQFSTHPKKPWINWRYTGLTALFIVLGVLGWKRWKNRRPSAW